jgi:hypothetical protein
MDSRLTADEYLTERVEQYRCWYDAKARRAKRWHHALRLGPVVAAAAVPPLAIAGQAGTGIAVAVLAVGVVILGAAESFLAFGDRWRNYRATEQYLQMESFYYRARAGPYRNLDEPEAFRRLVERAERAIGFENAATLHAMTLAPEGRLNGGSDRSPDS